MKRIISKKRLRIIPNFSLDKRNPGLFSSGSAQGSFRKNSNDSWISDRVIVAVCFRSPFLNPQEYMLSLPGDDRKFIFFC